MSTKIRKFFEDICKIPRCSGDEKGMSRYLLSFAEERGLEAFKEEASGNIIIRKPASPGYENSPAVILQGHMDMVCEKHSEVEHNFATDPIRTFEKDGWLCAEGTTLGADNGVAVAYALAILDAEDLFHPPLEVLITTDEETSMKGAELLEPRHLSGKTLFNLDAGEEGVFYVSSAGGRDYNHILSFAKEPPSLGKSLCIHISGLKGGHSGADIDKERGSSAKILGRILYELRGTCSFELAKIQAGAKKNAIAREASARIQIAPKDFETVRETIKKIQETLNFELKGSDELQITVSESDSPSHVMDKVSADKLIDLIMLIPHGVLKMSKEIEGLVVCSQNLGVIETLENTAVLSTSIRSSVASLKEEAVQKMEILTKLFAIDGYSDSDYPEWAYQSHSKIRPLAQSLYSEIYGEEPCIRAIHAGLECGFFADLLKENEIDILSFGPTMLDIHSPDERLDLASFERVYDFLVRLLAKMK